MNRKLERVFRSRPLTAEEAARDKEVRRAVQAEFPPATTPHESRFDSLGEALRKAIRDSTQPAGAVFNVDNEIADLRKAIRDSTQPAAEIAAKAHLSPLALSQFLAGERDIHLETDDRLAEVLGIKLTSS